MSTCGQGREAMRLQAQHGPVVVGRCGATRVAVPVHAVVKVVAAPLPARLPDAPARVAGLVNFHGTALVVLDFAQRGAAARDAVTLDARIVVVDTPQRRWGLLCEEVEGTLHLSAADWHAFDELMPGVDYLAAGRAGEADLIVLRDPATWLSEGEVEDLDAALKRHQKETRP